MTYEHFVELLQDEVQIAALAFMATMYTIKVVQLLKLNPVKDRTPNRGNPDAGMRYSFATIAMPWNMQCYREHAIRYGEFVVFHLAVAAAITATFIMPYWPGVMRVSLIAVPALAIIALGLAAGVSRLVRRVASPAMRAISTPDDYFSIVLLDCYLASALLAIPHSGSQHWSIVLFFALTTFFLIYVPFSKISHYLLWPFNRYLIGKHFGKRGVYPKHPGSLKPVAL